MKMKTIVASVALVTLGSIGNALADQGENTLNFTLNADVTKAVDTDNIQIRVYNQGNELPSSNINLNLQESLDTSGNLVWGSTGNFDAAAHEPQIDPADIYVVEVYSKSGSITYQSIITKCDNISLQNGSDTDHMLSANCDRIKGNPTAYAGVANTIPNTLEQIISAPVYFGPSNAVAYTISPTAIQGDSLYIPLAFFAHLPNWGDDLSNYNPGTYTGSGSMIIQASWT